MNEKAIKLHVWKDTKLNQDNPKVLLKSMSGCESDYSPENNARELARLFSTSLPSNTLDIFYRAIADEILPLLDSQENIEILKSPYDLSNRVRIAISLLAE